MQFFVFLQNEKNVSKSKAGFPYNFQRAIMLLQ